MPKSMIPPTIAADAPQLMPSTPGSASGLRVSACMSAPAAPSATPDRQPEQGPGQPLVEHDHRVGVGGRGGPVQERVEHDRRAGAPRLPTTRLGDQGREQQDDRDGPGPRRAGAGPGAGAGMRGRRCAGSPVVSASGSVTPAPPARRPRAPRRRARGPAPSSTRSVDVTTPQRCAVQVIACSWWAREKSADGVGHQERLHVAHERLHGGHHAADVRVDAGDRAAGRGPRSASSSASVLRWKAL